MTKWKPYKNGSTIGTTMIDSIILNDEESYGARITLTENRPDIPFIVTIEIYDILKHCTVYHKRKVAELAYEALKENYDSMRGAGDPHGVDWSYWCRSWRE
jgi:hypothetical protein